MEFPRRTFDGEGVRADVDFGPTLMLNRNRCILCTRCVRFMREVHGDAQIGIVDRGYRSEISTFEEHGVHALLSGNLMDVCPVGAITTRDYRFKSRPWDNPVAVDTICTSCSKGCNTTAWLKAKPEWAKGPQLIRVTPRFNPDVNGYWMCDIGRFGYHWVEGSGRLTTPLVRTEGGTHAASTWLGALTRVREMVRPLLQRQPSAFRMLVSAHASHEELFLVRELARAVQGSGAERHVSVMWRTTDKAQPAGTTFAVPPVDAPNVAGARDLGLSVPEGTAVPSDARDLQSAVTAGAVGALYVIDPGPSGNLGDVSWLVAARAAGTLPCLVVQAAVESPLTAVADIVLPGTSWAEKDGTFTNDQGRVQATSRAMTSPGDARDDWRIVMDVAGELGVSFAWTTASAIRAAVAKDLAHKPEYATLVDLGFATPVPARTWLESSNPSERWKWDHMFQDLPPVKAL
jgi:NADH-quinone oxidoreductase subunit G